MRGYCGGLRHLRRIPAPFAEPGSRLQGYPKAERADNCPEFTITVFMAWALQHGIRHILIQPGRRMQNGFIGSFNGKFRDEHLNESWFATLQHARVAASIWKQDYDQVRPHISINGCRPPSSPTSVLSALPMKVTLSIQQSISLRANGV